MFWPSSQQFWGPLPGCCAPFPSAASGPGSQGLVRTHPWRSAPFPSAAPVRAAGRVSGSLQTGTGACLQCGRGWLLWGSVCPLSPPCCLPPPAGMGRFFSGVSQFANRWRCVPVKKLFSSSSLSAIRVVSSAYLRLLVFLPAILIPACASSSSAFLMMYSAYKLNNQGDNIQP